MTVLSEPLHPVMGRLLLKKPESVVNEVVDTLLREAQSSHAEMYCTGLQQVSKIMSDC